MAPPGRSIYPMLALFLFVYACSTVPYTERKQIMMLSEGEEEKVGRSLFTQVKERARISPNPEYNALCKRGGQAHRRCCGKARLPVGVRGDRG